MIPDFETKRLYSKIKLGSSIVKGRTDNEKHWNTDNYNGEIDFTTI